MGMLHNVAVEIEEKTQVLAVGATKASAIVTVVSYADLHLTAGTPSGTLAFGTPDPGDTVVLTGLPGEAGPVTFTCVAAAPGANEFSDADELAALIDALDDLGASNLAGTITITVATAGAAMNSATIGGTGTFVALAITFSGGIDAAILTVDGTELVESTDWDAETSNDVTADNLQAAIDALARVSAANPAANAITVLAADEGYTGNTIALATSDATNLTISGATLSGGTYLFSGSLTPAPILNSGGVVQAAPSFSGSTFLTEVQNEALVVAQGDYFIDYRSGRYKVFTPDGESGSITATWKVAKMKVQADIVATFADEMTVNQKLTVLAEGEVTVTTAGTPVAPPSNASAKAVLITNNNVDGTLCAVGLAATVDANSTPPIGRVLSAYDSTVVYVSANSNEIYVDSTVSAKKFTYQILG